MVPPPDNTGDEFPDFDSMAPEEQLAWLESLAKRQGVNADELTTDADQDIPIPEDVEIDEPGYVPFEGSTSARLLKEAEELAALESVSELVPDIVDEVGEEIAEIDDLAEVFDLEGDMVSVADDGAEPTHWLESLSAQPGEAFDDQAMSFDSEPLDLPEDEVFEDEVLEASVELDDAIASVDSDPLDGIDPMLWLESLAARQGASQDELLTTADLDVLEVADDVEIDEPGYVPFEGSASARLLRKTEELAALELTSEPEMTSEAELAPEEIETVVPEEGLDVVLEQAYSEEVAELDVPELAIFDDEQGVLEGADPMAWLESLAKRQGAKEEELTTHADLDIPELPADTEIDEPGYVEYSPFDILPRDQSSVVEAVSSESEIESPELLDDFIVEPELFEHQAEDETLAWLEDLASEPDEDFSEMLSFKEEESEPIEQQVEPEMPIVTAATSVDDPLAGMTDDDIAYAQMQGQLTGEQELAWLKRQALKLAEAREEQRDDIAVVSDEDVEPAQPVELPDWVQAMRDEPEEVGGIIPALLAEDSTEPVVDAIDLKDWLDSSVLATDTAELSTDDVDSLWDETPEADLILEDETVAESELVAFLEGDFVPDEVDLLAEALDAEYERRLIGDDSEPEWYTEAVASVMAETPSVQEAETPVSTEPAVSEADPVEMPGWLQEVAEEPPDTATMPDWFAEPEIETEATPDWLSDVTSVPEALDEVFEVVAEPTLTPVPVSVEPEAKKPMSPVSILEDAHFDDYRQRLEENPNDHTVRLALARALRARQEVASGLDQYEMLIDNAQLLPDISEDLDRLLEEHPDTPRIRRLLGDTYMRREMLQEALAAYRNALNQL